MTDKQWRVLGWVFVALAAAWFAWFFCWLWRLPWG